MNLAAYQEWGLIFAAVGFGQKSGICWVASAWRRQVLTDWAAACPVVKTACTPDWTETTANQGRRESRAGLAFDPTCVKTCDACHHVVWIKNRGLATDCSFSKHHIVFRAKASVQCINSNLCVDFAAIAKLILAYFDEWKAFRCLRDEIKVGFSYGKQVGRWWTTRARSKKIGLLLETSHDVSMIAFSSFMICRHQKISIK